MRDILADVRVWLRQGKGIALATVVGAWGSAPRPVGSKMAVAETLEMAGSVSGGCVEATVVVEALEVLQSGRPKRLLFGVTDESAWEVGLACGGQLDLFLEPLAPLLEPGPSGTPSMFERLARALDGQESIVRASIIRGPDDLMGQALLVEADGLVSGSIGASLQDRIVVDARDALARATSEIRGYPVEAAEAEVFFDVQLPSPVLVIVGGVHLAIELARQGRLLGYRVVVVDPRKAFASRARFPQADQLVHQWPDKALEAAGLTAGTAVAVLSHDPKLDDPALMVALPSAAFYVGALGSQRTQELRRQRLLEAGVSADLLHRLHAPIGLDLGGRATEEIALSIMAEIVAARSGSPLAGGRGQGKVQEGEG
jgi:xanthine dehydrogenase accessory factor